ncbi:uncharacterized protein LOC126373689 [Pectinophora gossypiella]|uniref:uncharacterized protein LOC126373689 n=1 Tax=Pectinophora gossypiella TaxID=13191 RepID=UPI00214DF2A5|nr:uncharacterized protein LOC126373689 [Pectinophora gossypiella]
MQEYGGGVSSKSGAGAAGGGAAGTTGGEYRDAGDTPRHPAEYPVHHLHAVMQQKTYGCSNKDLSDPNMATYCRVATGIYEATASSQQYQNPRYNNSSAPTFSSPPNSPLVGLVFDPSSPNYSGPGMIGDRGVNSDRRSQSSWSISNQEPIGTGAKKKIVKSQDKRNAYNADPRYHERYKDSSTETDRQRKQDRNLNSESTSSLDFFAEGERMVSELCNIPDSNSRNESNQKQNQKSSQDEEKNKPSGSSEVLLTALDKIVIHDQIPNQIVQLAIEACTDAENIAIAHHNRPCFKNIHSICAKTRSNVQKPDSAVANLHSQGIPWVIKNFIFSFVRILDGWKGVKELLSEKHDTFSRIENKYYSPNIRECFVQWQAVTKEMLTHIYKTFKCLDHGFTMEQKSFTHNYYATNSAAPRHQNQNKFQPVKPHISTPRPVNASPQPFNAVQPPWVQNQTQGTSQSFNEGPWPARSGVTFKKFPVVPPPNSHNFYPLNDQTDMDTFQKAYKCDPCSVREAKPRQSWTITNVPDFRTLEGMCHADQRELYTQLKHKMDAELGKAPGQPLMGNMPCDLLQRRDMELKAKMIPLSHVEKTLIPSMAAAADMRGCYVQKNNSCGDTKEEADFFAAWGQMVQKEPSDFITHHSHNVQIPSNVVTISNNISGPVQFIDPDNDEFHEISKVYMKPGSYKVPIKPADPISPFVAGTSQEVVYDNSVVDDMAPLKMKIPFPSVTLAPQPKYNMDSWPCLMSRRMDDIFGEDHKMITRHGIPCLDMRTADSLDILSSMTSDRAWEAAKQSAPKLMDFIHEGSKSDTARLYDALGLSAADEYSDELKQVKLGMEQVTAWATGLPTNHFMPKDMPNLWEQQAKQDYVLPKSQDPLIFSNDSKYLDSEQKGLDPDDHIDVPENKSEETKENTRCPNFDHTGNYVRDDNQKKSSGKSKVAVSGMWYHPKKKKPLPAGTVKKFEAVLANLSQLNESVFIQHDMDIKVAPRFYEVVKYPMCLHDISTKLKNSSYTEYEQVVQDFRRIFNNVRLYLKSYPDITMKKNVNKISSEFEKLLNEEFQSKWENKPKSQDNAEPQDTSKNKKDEKECETHTTDNKQDDASKKLESKTSGDDKK